MPTSKDDKSKPLSQANVLEDEFIALNPDEPRPKYEKRKDKETDESFEERRLEAIYKSIHALPQGRSALCLSGGGIRSATFCLGILQGLARCDLLGKFDYLSTVSGGGYIGSWLTAWIHRSGFKNVLKALREKPTSKVFPEPPQISHLRTYSNYLSPKIGAFSVDTWTLITIYLRNLFLNWLVFVPLLLALLMIPRFYVWAIRKTPPLEVSIAFVIVGLGLGSFALAHIASHRPSLRKVPKRSSEPGQNPPNDPKNNLSNFLLRCMIPLVLAVTLLTVGRAWYLNNNRPDGFGFLWVYILFGAALHFFAWTIYARHLAGWAVRLRELLVVLLTGALGGGFLWLLLIPAKMFRVYGHLPSERPDIFASIDGPLLMLVFLLMGILSIGIGSRRIHDEDREWWARAGAWVMLAIVLWSVFNWLVIFGPPFLLFTLRGGYAPGALGSLDNLVIFLGFVSGFITILFGLSSKTPATVKPVDKAGKLTVVMDYAVKLAAPLFALFLVMFLSLFTDLLFVLIRYVPKIYDKPLNSWKLFPALEELLKIRDPSFLEVWRLALEHLSNIRDPSFWELLGLSATMLLIGYFMSRRININDFSLHSMYRNRLIRAYLGASNKRAPQSFTGFDLTDDLNMSELWPNPGKSESKKSEKPPFHILNMTWNLVGGKNLAWQNRKAVSFTVSPLHCGNARYGYRSSATYGGEDPDTISLGTALTVSGAAASPNMGYHSSPAITFLMTLFNARLGWWLGNPKHDKYFRRPGPSSAVAPMFEEAFGMTDEEKSYIYLSDGGHFENLGLYEMVRRRCHYIFVIDASRDPDYKFENLGNAIRTTRVDLGVPIEIEDIFMYPRQANKANAYCALGQILYTRMGESTDGLLVYIKPVINRGEPTDVYNYAQDRDFPHESTSDQWFSEQQFESYRMLGFHAIEQMFPDSWSKENKDFRALKTRIEELLEGFNKK